MILLLLYRVIVAIARRFGIHAQVGPTLRPVVIPADRIIQAQISPLVERFVLAGRVGRTGHRTSALALAVGGTHTPETDLGDFRDVTVQIDSGTAAAHMLLSLLRNPQLTAPFRRKGASDIARPALTATTRLNWVPQRYMLLTLVVVGLYGRLPRTTFLVLTRSICPAAIRHARHRAAHIHYQLMATA